MRLITIFLLLLIVLGIPNSSKAVTLDLESSLCSTSGSFIKYEPDVPEDTTYYWNENHPTSVKYDSLDLDWSYWWYASSEDRIYEELSSASNDIHESSAYLESYLFTNDMGLSSSEIIFKPSESGAVDISAWTRSSGMSQGTIKFWDLTDSVLLFSLTSYSYDILMFEDPYCTIVQESDFVYVDGEFNPWLQTYGWDGYSSIIPINKNHSYSIISQTKVDFADCAVSKVNVEFSSIPEPTSLLLLGTGIIGIVLIQVKKNR